MDPFQVGVDNVEVAFDHLKGGVAQHVLEGVEAASCIIVHAGKILYILI